MTDYSDVDPPEVVEYTRGGTGDSDVESPEDPSVEEGIESLLSSLRDGIEDSPLGGDDADRVTSAVDSVIATGLDGDEVDRLTYALETALAGMAESPTPPSPSSPPSRAPWNDSDEDEQRTIADLMRDILWVIRIAASTTRRAAGYSLRSGVRTGARMVRAAGASRSLEDFVAQSQEIAIEEMDRMGVDMGSEFKNGRKYGVDDKDTPTVAELRERGTRLLEMSADVEHSELIHPAYSDILDQLAPDEARILRFLATEGPQPAVNVRDVGWMPASSNLVAAGLSMVGTQAGCSHEDMTTAYLNNLERLGLVWFSDEPVDDVKRYQLVEAQPEVKEARDTSKRPKVIRRSIHLTPFGVDFCRVCLPLDFVSENASSVYTPPKDRVNRNETGESGGVPRSRNRRGLSNGTPDSVRNPHVDDHWEQS
jgi:hypothetical protein